MGQSCNKDEYTKALCIEENGLYRIESLYIRSSKRFIKDAPMPVPESGGWHWFVRFFGRII